MAESKSVILQRILQENQQSPKQGTAEWLELRKQIVGGSEMNVLDDTNPYDSTAGLVAKKCGLGSQFRSNIYCNWGHLFENVSQSLISRLMGNSEIVEIGNIRSNCEYHRYSPDGLIIGNLYYPNDDSIFDDTMRDAIDAKKRAGRKKGINKKYRSDEITAELFQTTTSWIKKYIFLLLEFKSPFNKLPLGFIPDMYMSQVLSGLSAIKGTDSCLFVNVTYKSCSLDEFDYNSGWNSSVHDKGTKEEIETIKEELFETTPMIYNTDEDEKALRAELCSAKPMVMGSIIFYFTPAQKKELIKKNNIILNENAYDIQYARYYHASLMADLIRKCFEEKFSERSQEILKLIDVSGEEFKTHMSGEQFRMDCGGHSGKFYLTDLLEMYVRNEISVDYVPFSKFTKQFTLCKFYARQHDRHGGEFKQDSVSWAEKTARIVTTQYNRMKKHIIQHVLNKNFVCGVLPWKMLLCDIIPQGRPSQCILERLEDKMRTTMEQVRTIGSDRTSQYSTFHRFYPNNLKKYVDTPPINVDDDQDNYERSVEEVISQVADIQISEHDVDDMF
jgi:hypothetical protein